jgi:hypothetical protein
MARSLVAFSTPYSEIETLAAPLDEALRPLGYRISQQVRGLDAVKAAAADPGYRGFWTRIRRQSLFLLVNGVSSELEAWRALRPYA